MTFARNPRVTGRLLTAALLSWGVGASAAQAETLLSVKRADGEVLVEAPAPGGARWCVRWRHSVTGGKVADCFSNNGGRMVLERSFLHDFAAGLGTVEGRGGRLVSAPGGGYWIEGIDQRIPGNALVLRIGSARVGHRLEIGGEEHALSAIAPGERVIIRLRQDR
jgi:hypothetical protein